MTAPEISGDGEIRRGSPTRKRSVILALRYYGRELARRRLIAVPALLLPALGTTCLNYLAPLAVAGLVGHLAGGGDSGAAAGLPYLLAFAGLLLLGELLWRGAPSLLYRVGGGGAASAVLGGQERGAGPADGL